MKYRITLDLTNEVRQATLAIAHGCAEALDIITNPDSLNFIREEVRQNIIAYLKVTLMQPGDLSQEEQVLISDPGRGIWSEVLMIYWESSDVGEHDHIPDMVRSQVAQAVNDCLSSIVNGLYSRYGIRLEQSHLGEAPRWLSALGNDDTSTLIIVVEQ